MRQGDRAGLDRLLCCLEKRERMRPTNKKILKTWITDERFKNLAPIIFLFAINFFSRIFLLSKGLFHYDTADFLLVMKDKVVIGHSASYPLIFAFVKISAYIRDALCPGISYIDIIMVSAVIFTCMAAVAIFFVFNKIFGEKMEIIYGGVLLKDLSRLKLLVFKKK
jgi:hypothetical protein